MGIHGTQIKVSDKNMYNFYLINFTNQLKGIQPRACQTKTHFYVVKKNSRNWYKEVHIFKSVKMIMDAHIKY